MTDLADKADEATPVVRAGDVQNTLYRLESYNLVPAEDIGNDEFPQYGDFLEATALDANRDGLGNRYVECPGGLANELVEAGAEAGTVFRVETATKTQDDTWTFDIEVLDETQQESL